MNSEPATSEQLPSAPRPRRRWLTLLLGLLIFGGGFVCGAGMTVVVAVHRLQYAIHHPEDAPGRVGAMLKRRLGLNDSQRIQIEDIITRRQVDLAETRREFQPKVMKTLEKIRDEISAVLTESQRERWVKMFDDVRDKWLPPMPAEREQK
jgi:hypothetical protein